MKTLPRLFVLLLSIATPVLPQRQSVQLAPSGREVAQRTLPSVVLLVMGTPTADGYKLGSGFFVTPDVVATNYHVVSGSTNGVARIDGKTEKYEVAGFVGLDPDHDLALLKLKGVTGRPLTIGDSSHIGVGDEIFAVGNPLGLEGTFSQGIVSGVRQFEDNTLLQITAPISHGSSGGPVLDRQGRVVGVAVGSVIDGQSLNFAIPASYVRSMLTNRKPLISFAEALKNYGGAVEAENPETNRAAPFNATSGRRAPSLDTDEAVDRRSPSFVPIDARAITRISLTRNGYDAKKRGMAPIGYVFTPADGHFSSYLTTRRGNGAPDYVEVHFRGQNQRWDFEFTTWGLGQALSPGTYKRCQRAAFSEGTAGLDVDGNGLGSSSLSGEFTIYDLQYDIYQGRPRLVSLAVSFEINGSASGVLYYNSAPVAGLREPASKTADSEN